MKKNSNEFIKMLLFHEITHILVFSGVLYDYFRFGKNTKTEKLMELQEL